MSTMALHPGYSRGDELDPKRAAAQRAVERATDSKSFDVVWHTSGPGYAGSIVSEVRPFGLLMRLHWSVQHKIGQTAYRIDRGVTVDYKEAKHLVAENIERELARRLKDGIDETSSENAILDFEAAYRIG